MNRDNSQPARKSFYDEMYDKAKEQKPKEVWVPVKNYEEMYHISNFGRVKALAKSYSYRRKKGEVRNRITKEKIMKMSYCSNEYIKVILGQKFKYDGSLDNNKKIYPQKIHLVHRLVANHFIPNPENKSDVNHKDFNRKNNHVDNLEWTTKSENAIHSIVATGANRSRVKLTPDNVRSIRKDDRHATVIAKEYNVSYSLIGRIKSKTIWTHVK
jgi:hypothetical protein